METFLMIFHVVICIVLISVIILQSGKGASMGAVFGGGGSQTLFGARGPATFFHKFTTTAAILFLATSVSLARLAKTQKETSVIDAVPVNTLAPVEAPMDVVPTEEAEDETEEKEKPRK